jgi:hypothetical protein
MRLFDFGEALTEFVALFDLVIHATGKSLQLPLNHFKATGAAATNDREVAFESPSERISGKLTCRQGAFSPA